MSEKNKKQLLVPRGFAHGFVVLSKVAIVIYKCDNQYNKEAERGVIYNDKTLNINWKIDDKDIVLSEKDSKHPEILNADINFFFEKKF